MRSAMWGYLVVLLGIGIIIVMMLIYTYASTNESDYYLLKETTEAAMFDALDEEEYANNQTLVMDKDVFVASFIRRFSDINNYDKNYTINFYKISEKPPMASVEIKTSTGKFAITKDIIDIPIVNRIDGILDAKKE